MTGGYDEWQDAISAAFLAPHSGPTVLFLDDTELARLSSHANASMVPLNEAVLSRMRIAGKRHMFASVISSYRRWQQGPRLDAPPVLPVVAITVVAATRMRSDTDARATNYYLRLAQTLAPDADPNAIATLRRSLSEGGAFLDIVEMWRGLHAWIESQNGTVGISTIRDHPHFQRIGYPLSQALVRQSDRMMLTRLFQALNYAPGAAPSAEVIVNALDIWTGAAQNRLSDTLMRALKDDELRPLLASVVEAHAQAWDGLVLARDGRQRIALKLSIDLVAWQTRWLFPIPPHGPESLTLSASDEIGEVTLETVDGRGYYSAQASPTVTAAHLKSGVLFEGGAFTAEFPPSPVVFLSPDPETGTWTSVPGLLPFEDHLVAITAAHVTDFREVLSRAANEGWSFVPQRGQILLAGYALFRDVRFSNGNAFEKAVIGIPGLRRVRIAPPIIPRARFVRGLPLATSISSKHFLRGGEPDLLLPFGPEPRTATVSLDGHTDYLQANGFPLELRRILLNEESVATEEEQRGSKIHVVDADGQRLDFITLNENSDPNPPAGTASLGWTTEIQMTEERQETVVTGAHVLVSSASQPVLVRRGRAESWLLHNDGHTELLMDCSPPMFLSGLDTIIHTPSFEVNASPSARWLAQRRGTQWRITEIGCSHPAEFDVNVDVLTSWRQACREPNGISQWRDDLDIAGGAP